MIKQYFIQAWAQLRQQPLISAVSIAGTALAIFLIMLVVMMQQVKVVPFAPESNRDRFLHVKWMSISNSNWGQPSRSFFIRISRQFSTLFAFILGRPASVLCHACIGICCPSSGIPIFFCCL